MLHIQDVSGINGHGFLLAGEFGIVYRARLGAQGRSGREVAVKTLKGLLSDENVA